MPVVDIDFDVFKALTMLRPAESVTINDVLRKLLGLPEQITNAVDLAPKAGKGWVSKGVTFPDGTEFRSTYKGQVYSARVANGRLVDQGGRRAGSLSHAARLVTNNSVDGWSFWDVKRPGDMSWRRAKELRELASS